MHFLCKIRSIKPEFELMHLPLSFVHSSINQPQQTTNTYSRDGYTGLATLSLSRESLATFQFPTFRLPFLFIVNFKPFLVDGEVWKKADLDFNFSQLAGWLAGNHTGFNFPLTDQQTDQQSNRLFIYGLQTEWVP